MNKEERIELRKLSEKLPQALKGNINKDPQMIIHNASHYIQHLLNTVNARIQNGTLPAGKNHFIINSLFVSFIFLQNLNIYFLDTLNKVFNGPVPVQNPLQSRIEKNEQKRRKVKLNRRK